MRFNTFLTPNQINACARILYYHNKFKKKVIDARFYTLHILIKHFLMFH